MLGHSLLTCREVVKSSSGFAYLSTAYEPGPLHGPSSKGIYVWREREREKERDRETETETDRDRQRDRERVLQYCSKVTQAKFDEFRSLFTFESSNEISRCQSKFRRTFV